MTCMKNCSNCGHATFFRSALQGVSGRYECCNGKTVDKNGICDRWTKNATTADMCRILDKEIKRLDKMPDEKFQLQTRPRFGENYRVIGAKK